MKYMLLIHQGSTPTPQDPEAWAWADDGGDEVHVTLQGGRVSAWELKRAGA